MTYGVLACASSPLVPTEQAQGPEGVPPTRFAYGLAEGQGERLVVGGIEDPSPVRPAFAFEDAHGIADARVGRNMVVNTGGPEVVERTEDVVMVAGRERELQELRIGDLTGRESAEKSALEEVLFATPPGPCDLCHARRLGADCTLVFEKALQNADRRVVRRANALGRNAVPAAVVELIADETSREALTGAAEVGSNSERAPVDTRLNLAFEERLLAERLVPAKARRKARHCRDNWRVGGVGAGCAQELRSEEGRKPVGRVSSVSRAVRSLTGENLCAKAFSRDAGALRGERRGRSIR